MQKNFVTALKSFSSYEEEKISIKELVDFFGNDAWAIFLIIICAPAALPLPAIPVLTQIIGIVSFLVNLQLALGKKNIWLPQRIEQQVVKTSIIKKACSILYSYHAKIEFLIKPRGSFAFNTVNRKFIHILCMFFGIAIALPLPFSNTVPSFATIIIMLAILEKDILLLILGSAIGTVAVTLLTAIYFFGVDFISNLF